MTRGNTRFPPHRNAERVRGRRSRSPLRRVIRAASTVTLGAILVGVVPTAAAAETMPSEIHVAATPVPAPLGADLSQMPKTTRTVFLPIATTLADALTEADATGLPVSLNLFPDVHVRVPGEFDTTMLSGTASWIGRNDDDVPVSVVLGVTPTLTGDTEVEVGTIWHDGDEYALWRAAPGVLAVGEVSDDAYLDNHVHPVTPNDEPAGDAVVDVDPFGNPPDDYTFDYELTATSSEEATAGSDAYVDVLIVYTPSADATYGGSMKTLAQTYTSVANEANAADGIAHRFRPITAVPLSFTETRDDASGDLRKLTMSETVKNLRIKWGADLVALMGAGYSTTKQTTGQSDKPVCGLAYQPDGWSYAEWGHLGFSLWDVNRSVCGTTVGAHELGHNITLRHDWANDDQAGAGSPYDPAYNHGYLSVAGDFRTIMAYDNKAACPGGSCKRIPNWSNPNKNYNGLARGQATTLPLPAYDAAAVAYSMPKMAKWHTVRDPFGSLEIVRAYPNGARLIGHAMDPDTRGAINVQAYVNGVAVGSAKTANVYRPDIGDKYPGYGDYHGFSFAVALSAGTHTICVRAINVISGYVNPELGCKTFTMTVDPVGNITSYNRIPGGARIYGWALDPNTSAAISVRVYVNGTHVKTITANQSVVTPPSTWVEWGSGNSFYTDLSLASGVTHNVCVTGVNVGDGVDRQVHCLSLTLSGNPAGSFVTLYNEPGGLAVEGWAVDPDTTGHVKYQFTINGVVKTPAGGYNNLWLHPPTGTWSSWGGDHSFYYWFTGLSTGLQNVCVTALNYSGTGGSNTSLGCKTINYTHDPVGSFTLTPLAGGAVQVDGWALDPDTHQSVDVVVTYAGIDGPPIRAEGSWSGDSRYPIDSYGTAHGFSTTGFMGLNPETRLVCVTAKNLGEGQDSSLGCHSVS